MKVNEIIVPNDDPRFPEDLLEIKLEWGTTDKFTLTTMQSWKYHTFTLTLDSLRGLRDKIDNMLKEVTENQS